MTGRLAGHGIRVPAARVRICFRWDAAPRPTATARRLLHALAELYRSGDLPPTAKFRAIAVLTRGPGEVVSAVSAERLYSAEGAVQHEGDTTTDDGCHTSSMFVDLTRVPPDVAQLVFAVSSLSDFGFSAIDGLRVSVVDDGDGTEIAGYLSSYRGPCNTEVLARITRGPGGWVVDGVARQASCSSTARVAAFAALHP